MNWTLFTATVILPGACGLLVTAMLWLLAWKLSRLEKMIREHDEQ